MLRISVALLLLLSLITPALGQVSPAKDGDIAGAWILIEQFKDETHAHRMSLEVAGNKITGRSGPTKIEGDITESVITLKWLTDGGRVDATYTGKAQDGLLKGEGVWGDVKLQWSAHLDYNQIREGTTVYLPVFQEGALLFMGDGHAAG